MRRVTARDRRQAPPFGWLPVAVRLLPGRADSERSWTVTREAIEAKNYDQEDRRTPEELLDLIEAKGREVAEAVAQLRALRRQAENSR
jgi:hypothetical protein